MSDHLGTIYLTIMFLNFLYLVVLLYGGIWYTNQQTVQCPRCGVKYPKYHVGNHECHPSLVGDDD
ncbi:hypothetical protein M0R89_21235 (plasmid) [Halorussus limi]|uniref:Uncharacterized protein n=1 Tax=Halorussus limi TaxID=2938695 RepID=A0A8U0I0B5_9EURY|nr:hypothetical protein [Halorussus limi]UPV76720.1 hypothetical protein M0R89_21235 [Halorussus limi]